MISKTISNKLWIKTKSIHLSLFLLSLVAITSCGEDEGVTTPKVNANFTSASLGISESSSSADIQIQFSRALEEDITVKVQVAATLDYGTDLDFFTAPALDGSFINLEVAAGSETASFSVYAGSGLNIEEDRTLIATLVSADSMAYAVGSDATMSIVFTENFLATSGTIELDAGGASFTQQAFVDLNKATQFVYRKDTWDLGFYCGESFRVTLNSPAFVMARKLDKTDMTAVTAEDTAGFIGQMVIPQFDPSLGSSAWVDTPDGDLSTTAFGEISAADSDNAVYIVKRDGDGRNWKKVRILRSGQGYSVQYADINSSTFQSLEVAKNDTHNFVSIDLDHGIVTASPEKTNWDFQYGTYTELLNLGGPGLDIPYGFNDYIVINRYSTQISMVLVADLGYESMDITSAASLVFDSEVNAIGSGWRNGGGPSSGPSLLEDRYYVIQDSEENYYKLKFNRLTSTSGERGYPEFSFELIQ